MKRHIAAAIIVCSLLPAPVSAYRVYTTLSSGQSPPNSCTLDQPRKLRWTEPEITYFVEPVPAEITGNANAIDAVKDSFAEWEAYDECGTPNLIFGKIQAGLTVKYDEQAPQSNENAIVWVESFQEWSHSPGILALTTLTYSRCTGIIVDADIEINLAQFDFSATETPQNSSTDVQNTITHEVGHFLGLDHSGVAIATMFANAPDAETQKRDLEEDDIAGLCCLYGSSAPIVVKSPEMVCEGAPEPTPEVPEEPKTGCMVGAGSDHGLCPLVLAGGLVFWLARRRLRGVSQSPIS